jgi:hypothetical protein
VGEGARLEPAALRELAPHRDDGDLFEYSNEQGEHGDAAVYWLSYLGRADFWEKTLLNWQSEVLAVGTMAVFTTTAPAGIAGVEASRRPAQPDGNLRLGRWAGARLAPGGNLQRSSLPGRIMRGGC